MTKNYVYANCYWGNENFEIEWKEKDAACDLESEVVVVNKSYFEKLMSK